MLVVERLSSQLRSKPYFYYTFQELAIFHGLSFRKIHAVLFFTYDNQDARDRKGNPIFGVFYFFYFYQKYKNAVETRKRPMILKTSFRQF